MAWSLTSPVTGAAQTGFTTPGYVLTADRAPDVNGIQHAVTGLTGTQTGATAHSIASPFTITFWKPKVFKLLGIPDPSTGVVGNVPMNVFKVITRKGVLPLAGQSYKNMQITTIIEVPAGADTADPANIRAALSLHAGALNQQSSGAGDTLISGVM